MPKASAYEKGVSSLNLAHTRCKNDEKDMMATGRRTPNVVVGATVKYPQDPIRAIRLLRSRGVGPPPNPDGLGS